MALHEAAVCTLWAFRILDAGTITMSMSTYYSYRYGRTSLK